jgi:hypothetical protein
MVMTAPQFRATFIFLSYASVPSMRVDGILDVGLNGTMLFQLYGDLI